ncbi:MAG: dynamin family protein [Sedimentitalea sp.]
MDMTPQTDPASTPVAAPVPDFAGHGLAPLRAFRQDVEDLQETLADICSIGGDAIARKTRAMQHELDGFAPAITFIGQIKSGKTTLVNALAARPGLLPADVNPWTSVVTSIHLNTPRAPGSPMASFQFFDGDEWDNLVQNGGRIGELSARTGADKEHERLQAQVTKMYEKTRERLGRKFEMLLGQTHNFQHLDDALVQRYVCLGDDFETGSARDRQGQFADITRSADLFLDAPNLPCAITLRDTPGLNDTFLMREQITIRAIRDSKICVVVLSAHQALSAVDMGLIRLIANVKARQIILFVNRIDELENPTEQVGEVRASLLKTLAKHDGPDNPTIVFGSGLWANAALTDTLHELPEASIDAMEDYGTGLSTQHDLDAMDQESAAWLLSGVPALWHEISQRVVESSGKKTLNSARKRAANMVSGLRASSSMISVRANSDEILKLSPEEIDQKIDAIESSAQQDLNAALQRVFDSFDARVDQAHNRFLGRALDSLLGHLENYGEGHVWNYSPDGLRLLMRTAYQVMRNSAKSEINAHFEHNAAKLTTAYGEIFDVEPENFAIEPPSAPDVPPPVGLAQTIALDVKTSWWKSWWGQRKGYRSFAQGFRDLIEAETTPMVDDLRRTQTEEIRARALAALADFMTEQRLVLDDICAKSHIAIEDLHGLFGVTSQEERDALFEIIFEELDMDPDGSQWSERGDAA